MLKNEYLSFRPFLPPKYRARDNGYNNHRVEERLQQVKKRQKKQQRTEVNAVQGGWEQLSKETWIWILGEGVNSDSAGMKKGLGWDEEGIGMDAGRVVAISGKGQD